MLKNILMICFVFIITNISIAQNSKIIGKIIEASTQSPIENAVIKVNGAYKNYAITNSKGDFEINVNKNDDLQISHVSYNSRILKSKNNMIIQLQIKPIELNQIIVSANPLQDISQSVVINDDTKRISQPRSVGHLFRDIKGFGISKKGAYASEPVFRAFKYEQLNIQYDGGMKILNACPNRMDPITTHVIPEEIEKIEIVKGPFTVRFGSNFGGIINLVSKNPSKLKKGFHSSVEGGFESNGNNIVSGASMLYVGKKFDIELNGSYRNFDDYKDGEGNSVPSSFKTTDYSVKLGLVSSERQRLQIMWRQSFGRKIKHAGLPMDSPTDDSYLIGLDYKLNDISEKIESFSAKIFHSFVDHLMDNSNRPNFKMVSAISPVQSSLYGGKAEIVFRPFATMKIFTGVDANLIGRKGNRTRIVKMMNGSMLATPIYFEDKIWQDANIDNIGLFIESNYKITQKTTLTAGIRSDFVSTSLDDPAADFELLYGKIKDKTETNISGNLAVKYQNNGFQAQLAFGRGVRTASMVERYINHFNVGVDPYEYVGNPNLKPEINNQIELSLNKKFETVEIGASFFHSYLRDYISAVVNTSIARKFMPSTPPIYTKQFINLRKASQTGVEFTFNVKASQNLSFTSDISYTRAQNEDLDEPLAQIPPFMSNLGAKYELGYLWFAISARLVAAQNRISTSFLEQKSPSFGTLDFRVGIEPLIGFTIGAAVLNIFDKTYYEHLNYSYNNSNLLSGKIYEPGRNITTYVKYKF